jgi:hypothetical protein
MTHPLHDKEFIEKFPSATDRRTGRSTAIALRTITWAIENPDQPISIRDHHPTIKAHQFLARMIADMIQKLELQHLTINRAKLTLIFSRETHD